jgi:hypothetical protein
LQPTNDWRRPGGPILPDSLELYGRVRQGVHRPVSPKMGVPPSLNMCLRRVRCSSTLCSGDVCFAPRSAAQRLVNQVVVPEKQSAVAVNRGSHAETSETRRLERPSRSPESGGGVPSGSLGEGRCLDAKRTGSFPYRRLPALYEHLPRRSGERVASETPRIGRALGYVEPFRELVRPLRGVGPSDSPHVHWPAQQR